jgi:hypothetical protein
VDVSTESYEVARKYMVRLDARDFADPDWVAALARAGGLPVEAFLSHFERLRGAGSKPSLGARIETS